MNTINDQLSGHPQAIFSIITQGPMIFVCTALLIFYTILFGFAKKCNDTAKPAIKLKTKYVAK